MVSFTSIASACAAALCALSSLTTTVDAINKELYGVNYDLRRGPDWDANKCKSASTIASELKTLRGITKRVRTYALTDCDVRPVLKSAKSLGMTVWLGVWVAADENIFKNEVATAQKLFDEGLLDSNVVGFNVGSEAVYRKDITAEQAINYLNEFKKFLTANSLTAPVAITDIIDTMIAYPDIVTAADVVTINQFPFWERVEADKAADQFKSRIQPLLQLAGNRDVYITETGWASAGQNENASDATPAAASRYMNDFYQLATAEGWKYYYFQGFDSHYKAEMEKKEDSVEASFGIYDANGKMKEAYANLKFGDLTTVSKDDTKTTVAPGSSSGSSHSSKTSTSGSKTTDGTTTDDTPGTVTSGSAGNGSFGTVGKSNSSSSKNKTNAAVSHGLASSLSLAVIAASLVLANL